MEKYKVIVTARSFGKTDTKAEELLKENNCDVIRLVAANGPVDEQIKKEIVDSDAVIAGLDDYPRKLIESAEKLKIISRYGVGYDKVDLECAKERGIAVTITPGANSESVADMAFALMLSCARNIPYMHNTIVSGESVRPQGVEMWEKTLGIIGAGRIGKGVARRSRGFNMKILCYDQYIDEEFASEVGAEYVDFETVIKESDFITIHSPLTPETENMFSAKEFEVMKKEAIIVNTARGGIIDEDALYEALKEGKIRAAGLDATVAEPPYNSALLELSNCITTPHAGAATREASSRMSFMAAERVVEFLNTGECRNRVC